MMKMSGSQVRRCYGAYKKIDFDGSGTITIKEFIYYVGAEPTKVRTNVPSCRLEPTHHPTYRGLRRNYPPSSVPRRLTTEPTSSRTV